MSASSPSIRTLIIDDHPVFREGLGSLLASQEDSKLVGWRQYCRLEYA